MASVDRARLGQLMAEMAAGDPAALFPFVDEFGYHLVGVVREVFRSVYRYDLVADPTEVDYHVHTAALVVFDRAAGWDPQGALPWVWANRAIRAAIVERIGHPSVQLVELADVAMSWPPPPDGPSGRSGDFDMLARAYPLVGLLVRAVRAVASERDAAVHLEYQAQKSMGDRQPSHTVGAMFDLSPDNVRQIDRRVRQKLAALAAGDADFARLAQVAWVGAIEVS